MDVVVNFTGGDTWVPSLRCLRRGGRLLTCGATAGFDPKDDIRYIWTFELNILGSNGWTPDDLRAARAWSTSGKLRPVIDRDAAARARRARPSACSTNARCSARSSSRPELPVDRMMTKR